MEDINPLTSHRLILGSRNLAVHSASVLNGQISNIDM